jgi:hypothetical protein
LHQLIERTLDLPQMLVLHVEIDQRRLDAFMPEEILEGEEVGPGF